MLSRISLLAAALLLTGCESGNNQPPAPTGAQPADATTAPVAPARPAETTRPVPGVQTGAGGDLEIGISDSGVSITANAVSQHLSIMRAHGIVEKQRRGRRVYHKVVHPAAKSLLKCIWKNGPKPQRATR